MIDNLTTVNCDRSMHIAVIGDSIVSGAGDTKYGNRGGYVRRLRDRFPNTRITNSGYYGIRTDELLRRITRGFSRNNGLARSLRNADHILIDVGRNDYQTHRDPTLTARNIKRMNKIIKLRTDALVTIATLIPTTRSEQLPFVVAVNSRLLRQRSHRFAVDLRFDQLSASLIDSGGIHPTSSGFDRMSEIAFDYLTDRGEERARIRAEDSDDDDLSNYCEQNVIGTDPHNADSDGDGLSDGIEVYEVSSDPHSADTDGDGMSDGLEVANGTDPLTPNV
ncbi:MAG: GDSL-type esterase/lipase family protein [Bdellovibrionota bacterium]|nr:MAG: GDSL-type esterase/lipase family protein [Bdellovibrionota bacterium]